MRFDAWTVAAGGMIYGFGVLLPTVHVFLEANGIHNQVLEVVLIGLLSWFAFKFVRSKLFPREVPGPRRYPGFRPFLFAAGLGILYIAWFTNAAHVLAGSGATLVIQGKVWSSAIERLMGGVIAGLGFWTLERALTTTKTFGERKMVRAMRKAQRQRPVDAVPSQE